MQHLHLNSRWVISLAAELFIISGLFFLIKNLFKFLFFTRDYNEYYKSPLVFNTVYANNDFEVIRKRKSIVQTLFLFDVGETVSFLKIHDLLSKRYAFFREYNDPDNFYYAKGDVFSNQKFIFFFLFKTLAYLGAINVFQDGKAHEDFSFALTEQGARLIRFSLKLNPQKEPTSQSSEKTVVSPYVVTTLPSKSSFSHLFSNVTPKSQEGRTIFSTQKDQLISEDDDYLDKVKQQIANRLKQNKIPNLIS